MQDSGHTHKELCDLAVRWLKRPHSRGGHGCQLAITECRSGYDGEVPDAIGWHYIGGSSDGSVVVECKTSRSDFLADKSKPHRISGGMGNWRYFFAPEGLIKVSELPNKWGLIEVGKRGAIKTVVGPYQDTNYRYQIERLIESRHDTDMSREMYIIVHLFNRISDPHAANELHRELMRKASRAAELSKQLEHAKAKIQLLELDA